MRTARRRLPQTAHLMVGVRDLNCCELGEVVLLKDWQYAFVQGIVVCDDVAYIC